MREATTSMSDNKAIRIARLASAVDDIFGNRLSGGG